MKVKEYLNSIKADITKEVMELLGISEEDSEAIVGEYIEFLKEKAKDKNNYQFIQEYADKAEFFDEGDWRNDLVQRNSKWRIGESGYVALLRGLKPSLIDAISFASGFLTAGSTDFKTYFTTEATKELLLSLCKIFKKLKPDEYCVYIHAEEADRRKRGNQEDLFSDYHEYIPKCAGKECDNKHDKWKCPFDKNNRCGIDDKTVFDIAKTLVKKNIFSPGYDGTFKLNIW